MFARLPYGANFINTDELTELHEALQEKILFRYQRGGEDNATRLEKLFSEMSGVKHALATVNCTSALRLALLSSQPAVGEPVAIPAISFVATAGAVLSCGLIPVLVPVDERLCLDPAYIPDDVKRVVMVHLDGFAAPIPAGKIVIEDCAQGMGVRRADGTFPGTGVHAAAFSFQHNKLLTSGTGGLLLTNDFDTWRRARSYHDHGSERENGSYPTWNENSCYGENLIANELVTAVQLQQVRKLSEIVKKLRENYSVLRAAIPESSQYRVVERRACDVPVTLRLLFETSEERNRILALCCESKIPHWILDHYLLTENPVLTKKGSPYADGFPWSYAKPFREALWDSAALGRNVRKILCFQIPPQLPFDEMKVLCACIAKILKPSFAAEAAHP